MFEYNNHIWIRHHCRIINFSRCSCVLVFQKTLFQNPLWSGPGIAEVGGCHATGLGQNLQNCQRRFHDFWTREQFVIGVC